MVENIRLSQNLVDLALVHLDFLQLVDSNRRRHYEPSVLHKSVARYEKCWIPLALELQAQGKDVKEFYPPTDVAWVWHCHMLSPIDYIKDCHEMCNGKVLDHVCLSLTEIERRQQVTRKLWEQRFPTVPFDEESDNVTESSNPNNSKIKYDVVGSCLRQSGFFYQCSLPHYRNRKFLEIGLERYRKFLRLRQLNPELFIVPTYIIDIIWHTHQKSPLVYAEETKALLGKVLPHNDNMNDRSLQAPLIQNYQKTRELWLKNFNENYTTPGGMYRGDAPHFSKCYSAHHQSYDLNVKENEELSVQFQKSSFQTLHLSNIINDYSAFEIINADTTGQSGECVRAQHSVLINRDGHSSELCKLEVTHVPVQQFTSVKLIKSNNKSSNEILASSHLIGLPQLPLESQTKDASYALNFDPRVEKAMLVRNLDGDYAVLKGKWVRPESSTSRGHLQVTVYLVQSKKVHVIDVPVDSRFDVDTELLRACVDLKLDQVSMSFKKEHSGKDLVVETMLATLFSICVLHVLLQPKKSPLSSTTTTTVVKPIDLSTHFMLNLVGYNELVHSDCFAHNKLSAGESPDSTSKDVVSKVQFIKKMNNWLYSSTEVVPVTGSVLPGLELNDTTLMAHCGGCGGCGGCW